MSYVLTTGSEVKCLSSGTVQLVSTAKLTVQGRPTLTLENIKNASISGCAVLHAPSATPPTYQCKVVMSVAGDAKKITVGGVTVALDTLTGQTGSSPLTPATDIFLAKADAKQTLLKGV